jgi:hypothetical protein
MNEKGYVEVATHSQQSSLAGFLAPLLYGRRTGRIEDMDTAQWHEGR